MSHEDNITKIKLCYTLLNNNISPEDLPAQLGVHRATVYRWKKKIEQKGIRKFVRDHEQAKRGRRRPNRTHGLVRARVLRVRREYKQCCGEKIRYILQRDYGESPSVATIYRILGTEYQLRSKWKKYSVRGPVHKGEKPREVVQTDTVDLGSLYAFTSIDTYTKEVSVIIQPTLTAQDGQRSLERQLAAFGSIAHIQRDGGSEFKKEWQEYATKHIPSIRTARPYKKNEQAFIERFNGILRKECVGYTKYKKQDLQKLQQKIDEYLDYYHNKRPHLSLNMLTPSEFAKQYTMSHLT